MLNKVTTGEVIKGFINDYDKIKEDFKNLLREQGYRWSPGTYHVSISGVEGVWVNYVTRTSLRIRWGKTNRSAILYVEMGIDDKVKKKILKFLDKHETVEGLSSPNDDYDTLNSIGQMIKDSKKKKEEQQEPKKKDNKGSVEEHTTETSDKDVNQVYEGDDILKRIIVSVPFVSSVQYEIVVKNPNDIDEIKEKLRETDASKWMHEPNFYEELGQNWDENVEEINNDDIYVPPPVKPGDRIHVGGLDDCIVVENDNPLGIDVTMVLEEDGTISWQLTTDDSDIALEDAKVIPINKEK